MLRVSLLGVSPSVLVRLNIKKARCSADLIHELIYIQSTGHCTVKTHPGILLCTLGKSNTQQYTVPPALPKHFHNIKHNTFFCYTQYTIIQTAFLETLKIPQRVSKKYIPMTIIRHYYTTIKSFTQQYKGHALQ